MMIIEDIKKNPNNSLKEIQKNTVKQVEDIKEEAQKSHKKLQENTNKQVMELIKPSKT
jgi:vacuolar-type H+-ATPase subunit E/Vma4